VGHNELNNATVKAAARSHCAQSEINETNFVEIAFYSPKMNLPSSGLAGGRAAGGLHGRATGGLDLGALGRGLGAALGSVLLLLLLLLPLLLLDLAAQRDTCR
jgi:hypothetical protein